MDTPLVSIIVPVYKVEDYMEECISSILRQKYVHFELILVDDGSPDRCGGLCDEYAVKDERIRVIHKENGGLSSARNAGMEIARGEYIAFVDSDDAVHEEYLDTMVCLATEHKADLVCCSFVKGENKIWEDAPEQIVIQEKEEILNAINEDDVVKTVAWNKLYHRKFFDEMHLRYPEGRIHEDMFLTPWIFHKAEKLVLTSRKLYFYRVREGSIMLHAFTPKKLDIIAACEKRRTFYEEIGNKDLYYWETESYIRNILKYYFLIRRRYRKEYGEEMRMLRKKGLKMTRQFLWNRHISWKLRARLFVFLFYVDGARNTAVR